MVFPRKDNLGQLDRTTKIKNTNEKSTIFRSDTIGEDRIVVDGEVGNGLYVLRPKSSLESQLS